jgi:hypothetical protein
MKPPTAEAASIPISLKKPMNGKNRAASPR